MKRPKCGAKTYFSHGGKQICPNCGYGSFLEQEIERQSAKRKAALVAIGPQPGVVFQKEHWILQIFYRNQGTRGEGSMASSSKTVMRFCSAP